MDIRIRKIDNGYVICEYDLETYVQTIEDIYLFIKSREFLDVKELRFVDEIKLECKEEKGWKPYNYTKEV